MRTTRHLLVLLIAVIAMPVAADTSLWNKIKEPGYFAIMRHGIAPGTGDPENFDVNDCTTQRNLSEDGRQLSTRIGAHARESGLEKARVYSSQWCRCKDTARLLGLGPVNDLPALNSFYQRYEDRETNLRQLRAFISAHILDPEPIVLVTHQVTINALTGQYTRQGETLIFKASDDGNVDVVGSIPAQ